MTEAWLALRMWSARQWLVAAVAGVATVLVVALPTAVIPNPVFGRSIEATWWSYPVVLVTGVLGGLLMATYVRSADGSERDPALTLGTVGGLAAFFSVGCPVCNKLVLLALGASGAVTWFAPVQPYLALASLALMTWALQTRLRGSLSCEVTGRQTGSS